MRKKVLDEAAERAMRGRLDTLDPTADAEAAPQIPLGSELHAQTILNLHPPDSYKTHDAPAKIFICILYIVKTHIVLYLLKGNWNDFMPI